MLRDFLNGIPLVTSGSAQFQAVIETAHAAASSDATILLTGESGTGKNVLAWQIHEWSPRRERPFVTVNCTTLSENLLESELFGHVKGSFTGAIKDKPGMLEAANGGTAFLDEIAELPPTLQTKFLRFLQDEKFERVGGESTIQVNARIIAATNRTISREIAEGRFRSDLYYRLNVIELHVPALRERTEDILPLAEWILSEAAARNGRAEMEFTDDARKALDTYSWPGNVRELRNAIERAVVLSRDSKVRKDDLPESLFRANSVSSSGFPCSATLEQIEQDYIKRVLAVAPTLDDAAATLGISISSLWRKRKRYHLD